MPLTISLKKLIYADIGPSLGMDYKRFPFEIIAVQRVNEVSNYTYIYVVLGKFENIDLQNQLIFITTGKGRPLSFKYILNDNFDLVYWEKLPNNPDFIVNSFYAYGSQDIPTQIPFSKGDVLLLQWEDDRLLSEILLNLEVNSLNTVNEGLERSDFRRIVQYKI